MRIAASFYSGVQGTAEKTSGFFSGHSLDFVTSLAYHTQASFHSSLPDYPPSFFHCEYANFSLWSSLRCQFLSIFQFFI